MTDSKLKPFVIRNFAQNKNYAPIHWSLDDFSRWLKSDFIDLRVASLDHEKGKIVFEKMCLTVNLRAQQYINWLKGELIISDAETTILPSTHSAYYDYRPAVDEFTDEFAEALSFDNFGIKGKFNDETVWIGSPGAYTPCHYDSYGYNLHLQLKGTKRWILFQPETKLSPTRIPYEESTIYSSFDIIGGDLPSEGPQEAYCVYLNEGDLLFIPPKWWHSVQCFKGDDVSGAAFSVNKWFPLESDEPDRKKECLIGCLFNLISPTASVDSMELMPTLDQCILEVFKQNCDEPVAKKPRKESIDGETQMHDFYNQQSQNAERLIPTSFNELKNEIESNRFHQFRGRVSDASRIKCEVTISNPEYEELPFTTNIRKVLNAFTSESTIQNVLKLMEDKT